MVSTEAAAHPVRRLRGILAWLTPLAFGFAVLSAGAGIAYGDTSNVLAGSALGTLGFCLLWARSRALVLLRQYTAERERIEAERLHMERKLLETQKLESLGVMAGGIAHDFNNLLAGILGYAELAGLQVGADSAAQPSLKQIEIAALRAADLTAQMLHYAGRGRFFAQRLDLQAVVVEALTALRSSISRNVALVHDLVPEVPAIRADAVQMRQILTDLILNASEAIGSESGTITVRTGVIEADALYLASTYLAPELPTGQYVVLSVSDTGCGIDPAMVQRIFDPFFTTKFIGRGMGLSAVLGIVRRHRGTLEVESKPGRGSTFRILLPAALQEPPPPAPAPIPAREVVNAGVCVLVIDDEPHVRAAAQTALQRAGFEVLAAGSGAEGLELFRVHQERIACTLVDFAMPGMNGEEVCRSLRRFQPAARLLLMSGYEEDDVMSRFAGLPVAGFLHKPFRMQELQATVQKALES